MSILNFSVITFSFLAAVMLSNCGSRITDLLPSGVMLFYKLEILFRQQADKQNLSLFLQCIVPLREGGLAHINMGSLFWIHRG